MFLSWIFSLGLILYTNLHIQSIEILHTPSSKLGLEYSPEPTELGLPVDLAKMSDIEGKRMNNLSELFGVYEVLLLLLDRFEEELDFAFNEVSYLW